MSRPAPRFTVRPPVAEVPVSLGAVSVPVWPPGSVVSRVVEVLERGCGDSVLLLLRGLDDDELRRLEGLTAAMWSVVSEPVSIDELVDAAAAQAPGVARDAVAETVCRVVGALVDAKVAEVRPPAESMAGTTAGTIAGTTAGTTAGTIAGAIAGPTAGTIGPGDASSDEPSTAPSRRGQIDG